MIHIPDGVTDIIWGGYHHYAVFSGGVLGWHLRPLRQKVSAQLPISVACGGTSVAAEALRAEVDAPLTVTPAAAASVDAISPAAAQTAAALVPAADAAAVTADAAAALGVITVTIEASPYARPDVLPSSTLPVQVTMVSDGTAAQAEAAVSETEINHIEQGTGVSAPAEAIGAELPVTETAQADAVSASVQPAEATGAVSAVGSGTGHVTVPLTAEIAQTLPVEMEANAHCADVLAASCLCGMTITSVAAPFVRSANWTEPVQTGDQLRLVQAFDAAQDNTTLEVT